LGGEKLDEELWARLAETDGLTCFNVYGPTECTDVTTVSTLRPGLPTIGRPLPGSRCLVLDRDLQLLPPGVVGELYIGGAGVSRGYYRRASWTAERFVPDPFSTEPGARLYRTGDLGRLLPDGRIAYIGRNDRQVKIHGFRIELGDV